MPKEGFVTVTLRKNLIEQLERVANDQPTSTSVTRAIQYYLDSFATKLEKEMPVSSFGYRGLAGSKLLPANPTKG